MRVYALSKGRLLSPLKVSGEVASHYLPFCLLSLRSGSRSFRATSPEECNKHAHALAVQTKLMSFMLRCMQAQVCVCVVC